MLCVGTHDMDIISHSLQICRYAVCASTVSFVCLCVILPQQFTEASTPIHRDLLGL